jgi:formate dehydrogenase beta subunit
VAGVTTESGVYQLLDATRRCWRSRASRTCAKASRPCSTRPRSRKYFTVEEAPFFSQRENQLVQAYMQQHGSMPPGVGADEMDDLF